MVARRDRDADLALRLARVADDGTLSPAQRDFFGMAVEAWGTEESFRVDTAARRFGLTTDEVEAMCEQLAARGHFDRYGYMEERDMPPEQRTKLYALCE